MRRLSGPICGIRILLPAMLLSLVSTNSFPAVDEDGDEEIAIGEVIVTAQRRWQSTLDYSGNIQRLDAADIEEVQHQHIHELLNRVAGVWVVRGSGQEHLTAIRSPVLSGAGSCGGFLFLEDGIPTRPSGFCNVNQLFELYSEQAGSIEVIRGPGNALYGSNALHGVVNVLMPLPGDSSRPYLSLELGANQFYRVKASLPFDRDAPWHGSVLYGRDSGFRDDSEHRQGKLHIKRNGSLADGDFTLAFTATDLDQDTAGFIFGFEAYRDRELSRMNLNPDAFRNASSQRLYGIWQRDYATFSLDIRPFVRHTDMEFLHHFTPGTPLEKNGHVSAGLISAASFSGADHYMVVGLDIEWADAFLDQFQAGPAEGSPFLVETRPQGQQYDYEVRSFSVAPFFQSEFFISERWTLGAGVRFEYSQYDYDNRMISGNTRDDGTECGFGGCLHSRPQDRSDSYFNFAPKFSASYRLDEGTTLFASLARGFRAPQMTELYRLQNGQLVSDLDSEMADSLEIGWRSERQNWRSELVAYAMRKRDSVFRDAQGFNVSGARTRHRGVEASFLLRFNARWSVNLDATYARHSYDFTFTPDRGEQFIAGRDVDTAPRWLGSTRLRYQSPQSFNIELQWVYQGEYYLDAENRFSYPGHDLFNLRAGWRLNDRVQLSLRLNNLADSAYADRADFGFGNYRYFPGRGREMFAEFRYMPRRTP